MSAARNNLLHWIGYSAVVLFTFLLGCSAGRNVVNHFASTEQPDPISVEQKSEVEYLVVKNGTSCLTIDFVIYEMNGEGRPLSVAGGLLAPSERMEFVLPPGKYCVHMIASQGGKVLGDGISCGELPDPTIPEHAKSTIYIEEDGICKSPVEA